MEVKVSKSHIFVYASKQDERCKEVSYAGRWHRTGLCWYYPLTKANCIRLLNIFSELHNDVTLLHAIEHLTQQEHRTNEIKDCLELPQPEGIKTELWLHQKKAVTLCNHLDGSMLALDLGTGKSLCIVAVIAHDKTIAKTLIVCPKAVQKGWINQFKEHCTAEIYPFIIQGNTVADKERYAESTVNDYTRMNRRLVLITNYESIIREPLASYIVSQKWDLIVADESHKLKAPGGKTSRYFSRLTSRARKRVCLTGTPLPNSVIDAYGQYRFIAPEVFGTSVNAMRAEYCVMGGYPIEDKKTGALKGSKIVAYRNKEKFNTLFYSKAYRVMSEDVLDLPPVIHTTMTCELNSKSRKIYNELKKELLVEWDEGKITAANGLVNMLRLSQITGGYATTDTGCIVQVDPGKMELLSELFDDIDVKEPIVIFARFTPEVQMCKGLAKELGRTAGELSGQMNDLEDYQKGVINTLVVQIQSGGAGIELQFCGKKNTRYCIYYSVSYSLSDYEQSLARVHRPGQKETVNYIHLVAENTIDDIIYKALQEKKTTVEDFLRELRNEKE